MAVSGVVSAVRVIIGNEVKSSDVNSEVYVLTACRGDLAVGSEPVDLVSCEGPEFIGSECECRC